MQTPGQPADVPEPGAPTPAGYLRPAAGGLWAAGERVTWVSALVLMLSALMGWYSGSGDGVTLVVTGWHTGIIGKIVFFIGLAVLAIVALRESGIELPGSVPESLVVLGLGAIATILVAGPGDRRARVRPAGGRAVARHLGQPCRRARSNRRRAAANRGRALTSRRPSATP